MNDGFHNFENIIPNACTSLDGFEMTWSLFDEFNLGQSLVRRPTELDVFVLGDFPFLSKFTRISGFADSFECGSVEQRSIISRQMRRYLNCMRRVSCARFGADNCQEQSMTSSSPIYDVENLDVEATLSSVSNINTHEAICLGEFDSAVDSIDTTLSSDMAAIEADDDSQLLKKSHDIIRLICKATMNKPERSIITSSWSHSLQILCCEFFSPANLQKFLALFWSCWYTNCPIIHRPTFSPITSRSELVATMVVVGACLSPDHRDRALANLWFNALEEVVFSDVVFLQDGLPHNESAQFETPLSVLQAGYCVCLFQTWEGSKVSKRRVRRHRYNALIYVGAIETAIYKRN